MNQLINTTVNESNEIIVSGRELHEFLGVNTPYKKWFDRMIGYGFEENMDFITMDKIVYRQDGALMPQKQFDHALKLDMAKEISMIQRNERGKQARQYFIEIEKKYKEQQQKLPTTYKEALLALVEEVEKNELLESQNLMLTTKIEEDKPKVTYYDKILQSEGLLTISQIAKDYGLTAQKLNNILHEEKVQYKRNGQWLLYSKHADKGYTKSVTFIDDYGNSKLRTKWTQKGRLFIHEILQSKGITAVGDVEN